MHKVKVFIWTMMLGAAFIAGPSYAAEKSAYVDLVKVSESYGKAKDYEKALKEKQSAYESERAKKIEEIQQLQAKMDVLKDKDRETKQAEFENKVKALQIADRAKQIELQKEQEEKMQDLMKDINEAVKKCAEKEGYSMVFNSNVLLYQDKGLDITDKVLEALGAKTKSAVK